MFENIFSNIFTTLAKDSTASHSSSRSLVIPRADGSIFISQSPLRTSCHIRSMTFKRFRD